VGQPVLELYADTPLGKEKASQLLQRFRAGESVHDEELQMLKPDGTPVWISLTVNAVHDAQGRVVESRSMVVDITDRVRAAEALRRSEYLLRQVLDTNPAVIFVKDYESRVLLANETMAGFYNLSVEEVTGRLQSDLHGQYGADPTDVDKWLADDREVIDTGRPKHLVESGTDSQNRQIWFQTGKFPLDIGQGRCGVLVISQDITERKRAEEALHRSLEETAHGERTLLALSQAAQAVQRARTPDEVYRTLGDEVRKLGYHALVFGLTDDQEHLSINYMSFPPKLLRAAEELTGLSVQTFRIPLAQVPVFQRIVARGDISFIESSADLVDGGLPTTVRPLAGQIASMLGLEQAITAPLMVGGETRSLLTVTGAGLSNADVPAVTAFANQASIALENARLVEEIQTRSTDLQELSARLFKAQEEERRRLSLELHDELGQALTGIGFDLAAVEKEWPPEVAPTTRGRLANVGSLVAEIDKRVSDMALDLRPQMLDDLGLLPTLRWYVNRYTRRMGIDVELEAVDFEERVTSEVATAVYRTVQEALTNVAKHAGASKVAIRLQQRESTVAAVVQDDGRGFTADKLTGAHLRERGAGLFGIRERVALLGGTCDIWSRPGLGTRLTIEIPI
jgi:PAS domain S-box-containing protein